MIKSQVVKLMRKHMDNNGLQDWSVGIKHSKKILATCYYQPKTIKISKCFYEINDCKRVVKTMLHEIGHALVGSGHGHNELWKRKCREIGLDNPSKYADLKEFVRSLPKYSGTCICYSEFRVERKRKRNGSCRICKNEVSWVETKTNRPINFNYKGF